jgi:hypothetical protein
MDWRKEIKEWKPVWALMLIFALCDHAAPHVEPQLPDFVPTTVSVIQVSGANVSAGMYSWSSQHLYR